MDALLNPSAICLVGASADPAKLAGKTLLRLEQHHFAGAIHLVNPRHESVAGRPCHATVQDVGAPIDVALISLPAAGVPDAVRACGRAGVRYAVVISSGFDEDPRAGRLAEDLASAVADSGVRLVGPNCEGIWSTPANMALTFGSAADRPRLQSGPVSLISQSGSVGAACMRRLQDRGVGCRYFVSSGNESDLTTMDYLQYMVDEGGSGVIALFVEGLRDGRRLRAIAARAAANGVRLIALCSGASELGRLATASHTGQISSAASVYRDVLRAAGVVQVDSFGRFVAAIETALSPRLPRRLTGRGPRGVGVVAFSGGSRGLLADACAARQVPMATFAPQTESALEAILPRFAFARNPVDLTGEVASNRALFAEVIRTVMADAHTEALIVQYANAAEAQLRSQLELYAELTRDADCPIVVSTLAELGSDLESRLRDLGIVLARDPEGAVDALGHLYGWRDAGDGGLPAADPVSDEAAALPTASWIDQVRLLEGAGVGVPGWEIWDDDDATVPRLRYPVALKALPEHVSHKTEAGLVFLGLSDADALRRARAAFRERVAPGTPALVQEMVEADVEMLIAVRTDPDFGPLLVIGAGGVTAEWQADVVHIPLPTSAPAIARALRRLRLWELLQPFRGRPACDSDALAAAAQRLGELYLSSIPSGAEVEINPVLVGPVGSGIVAVDVLCVDPRADRMRVEEAVG